MSISVETLAVAKKYTNDSLAGAGAVAGVPCQIQSKTAITGGTRITFLWVDNNGDSHTTAMDVMNGIDGQDGKGIQSVSVNENNHLIITYSDGTTDDAGQIEIHSAVDSVNGQTGNVTLDAEDVGALPDDTPIPSKTSDLTNDSGFITKVVNDLVSYYLKSETYSKTEVDNIATAIKNSRFEVVATLPTTDIKTNVIYLVPKSPSQTSNVKDEYINLDGTTSGWEKIGDTEIDLSNYVTIQALNTALADYTTTSDLTTLLAAKQDTLTFDNVPTENSNNPVKSGGVYSADANIYAVMGEMGAKNINKTVYVSRTTQVGIEWTVNEDGTVTANGTASGDTVNGGVATDGFIAPFTAQVILTGGISTLAHIYPYDQTTSSRPYTDSSKTELQTADATGNNEVPFYMEEGHVYNLGLRIKNTAILDNAVFKPMLRLASDSDNTYVPYAKTNKQLTDDAEALTNQANDIVNVLGAKNVLPFPYYEGSGTYNGVTITDNGDGSITLDGTCTGMSFFVFYGGRYSLAPTTFVKKNEDYIATLEVVSGSMAINSGTSKFVFRNYITNATSPFVDIFYEENVIDTRSVKFTYEPTASYDTSLVWYEFNVGTTFNNWRIRPMIRLASITDSTYQPYAKTNQQLTAENEALTNQANDMVNVLGAKNLLPNNVASKTLNGVTFTVNNDGSVTINGTATSTTFFYLVGDSVTESGYKLSGRFIVSTQNYISQDSYLRIGKTAGTYTNVTEEKVVSFSENSDIYVVIRIASGEVIDNVTLYPMLRLASDPDNTYVPYAPTNAKLNKEKMSYADNGVLGAKNLLPTPYYSTKGGTTTSGTLTVTENADGSVTIDGTASGRSYIDLARNDKFLKAGTYILSGGITSKQYVYINCLNNGTYIKTLASAMTSEVKFVLDYNGYDAITVGISIASGESLDNVTFYPMIRLASDGDSTYQPYAKTNRELTEKIDIVGNLFTTTTKVVDNITHGIATTVATLENLPIGTYVVSGQFNSDNAMSGGGLVQFASSGVIQNGANCSTIINQGFKANAGLTGIFNVTNATNQINLQIYTANADLTVSSARLAAIRIA